MEEVNKRQLFGLTGQCNITICNYNQESGLPFTQYLFKVEFFQVFLTVQCYVSYIFLAMQVCINGSTECPGSTAESLTHRCRSIREDYTP